MCQYIVILRAGRASNPPIQVETVALRLSEFWSYAGASELLEESNAQAAVRTHRPAIQRGP